MDVRKIVQKPSFIKFSLWLARSLPEPAAHGLFRLGANIIASRKPEVYRTVRRNLSHIPGANGNNRALDKLTKQAFFNTGRFYYDHYRHLGQPQETIEEKVKIPKEYMDHVFEALERGQGVLLVGTHTGNFDLGAMVVATKARGHKIQLLSLAQPSEGFKLMNEFRAAVGFEVTPITPQSLREGITRLKNGGIVGTALDWPHPEEDLHLEVFGKPSYVPLGGVRLALLTGARVMVASFYLDPDEGYKIHNIPPVEMERTGDREKDIVTNTKKLIEIFEELVVQHPDQWMMYHPFWPATEEEC